MSIVRVLILQYNLIDCWITVKKEYSHSEGGNVQKKQKQKKKTKSHILSVYQPAVFQMTELARSQIVGAFIAPPVATDSAMLDQQEEQESAFIKQREDNRNSDRYATSKILECYKLFPKQYLFWNIWFNSCITS